jgi:hypothetical protein
MAVGGSQAKMPTKLAVLISQMEGFGKPGEVPTVRNNPGDLRHGPNAKHPLDDTGGIGYYDSVDLGWEDLERQLRLYDKRGLTLQQVIEEYAPPEENDTTEYLRFMCAGLGVTEDTTVSDCLKQTVYSYPVFLTLCVLTMYRYGNLFQIYC